MSNYRLTSKGVEAYDRMWEMYDQELKELQKADPNFVEGWAIIDNDKYIKTLDDEVDILVGAYDRNVLYVLAEWLDNGCTSLDDKICFNWSVREVINRISERGLLEVIS